MAAAITLVIKNAPHYKLFYVTSPEGDLINRNDPLLFANFAMSDLAGVPRTCWWQEVTEAGDTPSVKGKIAIHTMTAAGFSVFKPCASAVTGFVHTYRVFMTTKRASEL
jgi:hypothetical protein